MFQNTIISNELSIKGEKIMRFNIIGSGGCVSLPKPLCMCKICKEARIKGHPFARFGCSLYLEDANLLVDTPENIVEALNYSNVEKIDNVLFSHVDPDHTLGMRVFEQLRLNWLEISKGNECSNPINVFAMEQIMNSINSIGFEYGSFLDYYENVRNLIKRKVVNSHIIINNIKVSLVQASKATVFVFENNKKKVLYAPCDVKPFPENEIFKNADYLIIGNTIVGEKLKDGFILENNNPLRNELFTMAEIEELKEKYTIKNVIITHLEEDWGKSFNDYLELENSYDGIKFAYDGMIIEV